MASIDQTFAPSRVDGTAKDKFYHLQRAKYYVTAGYNSGHYEWLKRTAVNKDFYQNKQWSLQEDKDTFLSDDTGNVLNRIKFTVNTIRPTVEQYRGNAIILNISAAAKSLSRSSVNRREKILSEQLLKSRTAGEFPNVGGIMRENDVSIGETDEQTQAIFENLYVDKFTEEINDLLNYSKRINKFAKKQLGIAQKLALSGLAVEQLVLHGGHARYESIESEDFIWDKDAREFDLTDSEFQGTLRPMDVPSILERWQLAPESAEALENYVSNNGNATTTVHHYKTRPYTGSKVPVHTIYWKDVDRKRYGWVKDRFGYDCLEPIISDKEKKTKESDGKYRYTEADLITPPDTPKNRELFPGDKKIASLYCDVLRYCVYIPGEVLTDKDSQRSENDVVLEFGMDEYQDTNYQDLTNVKFPFKVALWGYVDGEVFSPVDDLINPQRFMNRMLSLTESRFNSSGGSNIIIDEDAVEDAAQTYSDIKEGKPITVSTRGKGIPNTVGTYDATPTRGSYEMFKVVSEVKEFMQSVTGINEGLRGESTGQDQLVGVTKLMIQRGTLMQEPFYNAVTDIFLQMYDGIASVGKKYYIDNKKELAIIAGDEAVRIFTLSEDLRNEDFLTFVERENSDEALKNTANQLLQTFYLEMGLIDETLFSNLYDRSTPTKVMMEVRKFVKIKKENEKRAQEAQSQQESADDVLEQQMMQAEEAKQAQLTSDDREFSLNSKAVDHENQMEQISQKGFANNQKSTELNKQ
jgi:hypothetical protein